MIRVWSRCVLPSVLMRRPQTQLPSCRAFLRCARRETRAAGSADQVGPARRNTRAPSLLRTCATDRALELGLGHRRAALDLQPLRLVVELLLRPIATARGRAARPSARATARS